MDRPLDMPDTMIPAGDFALTHEALGLARAMHAEIDTMVQARIAELTAAGQTPMQAAMICANLYLDFAACIACTAARQYLKREPDVRKWRDNAMDAFARHQHKPWEAVE